MIRLKAWYLVQLLIFLIAGESLARNNAGKFHTIVVVGVGNTDTTIPQVRGLLDGLEEVGYVEAKNLKIHHIRAGNDQQLQELLKDMIRQGIEVIVATSSAEARIAKQVTSEVPIVFAPAVDPLGNGLVKSRCQPAIQSNRAMSYTRDAEDSAKQLAVFKQIVPGLRRVTLFYDGRPVARTSSAVLSSIARVARRFDMQVTQHAVQSNAEAVEILRGVQSRATDGVFLVCSAVFRGMRPLSELAASKRLPICSCTASQVAEEGTLMTYTPDMYYLGYRGAWYVDQILKGARPEKLRVETPTRFELVINITTARKIGLKIPPESLMLADKVFE